MIDFYLHSPQIEDYVSFQYVVLEMHDSTLSAGSRDGIAKSRPHCPCRLENIVSTRGNSLSLFWLKSCSHISMKRTSCMQNIVSETDTH